MVGRKRHTRGGRWRVSAYSIINFEAAKIPQVVPFRFGNLADGVSVPISLWTETLNIYGRYSHHVHMLMDYRNAIS